MDREQLEEIAEKANSTFGRFLFQQRPEFMGRFASAVAAAVKEEDARICKSQYVDAIGSGCDTDFAYNNALDHAAAAILASIKKVSNVQR